MRVNDDRAPLRRRVVTESSIVILSPIRFVGTSALVDPTSIPMLDAIADTLRVHDDIRLLEIRAYGSDGLAQFQQAIANDRAQVLADHLVRRGVARHRLYAHGVAQPPNGDPRPVFAILARDP